MAEHNDLGRWGEDLAIGLLRREGYIIMERDWTYGRSTRDIDIVCKTGDLTTVVFVEVKTRAGEEETDPEDAIDLKKIRHIGRAADEYVKANDISEELRFDIITVVGRKGSDNVTINHIQDAFNPLLA